MILLQQIREFRTHGDGHPLHAVEADVPLAALYRSDVGSQIARMRKSLLGKAFRGP